MKITNKPSPEDISKDLIHFIAKSPSPYHTVRSMKAALTYSKFTELREEDEWAIEKGGHYVVTRNGAALIAFTVPEEEPQSFRIVASHADSPTFQTCPLFTVLSIWMAVDGITSVVPSMATR